MKQHVIDADIQKIIGTFSPEDVDEVLTRYQQDGRWEDVSVDIDGDIILWKTIK